MCSLRQTWADTCHVYKIRRQTKSDACAASHTPQFDGGDWYSLRLSYRSQRSTAPAYNRLMARGWESKSVEAQMESQAAETGKRRAQLTQEELERERRKADLLLSRSRILQQLDESSNERYSELLRRTLAELDAQIAKLAP